MKNLIKTLFLKSIELGDIKYTEEEIKSNWIGNRPTSIEIINQVERKLKISFPKDYKDLLLITNGFKTSNDAVEPSFLPIEEVDYFKNLYPEVSEFYSGEILGDIGKNLERSILVAGKNEEQQFLLIPPKDKNGKWKYWKWAHWIPSEEEYENLEHYLNSVIEFLDDEIKEK